MKLTYIAPTTTFVDTETEAIMATSIQDRGTYLDQDLSGAGTTEETSGNLSRRRHRSQWDDEELDEQ